MPIFQIELDDGRKLRIDADNQESALAGVQHFQGGGQPAEQPSVVTDVAKQVPAGLVKGVEGIATGPAHIANMLSGPANWLGRQAERIGLGAPDEQAVQNREKLRQLVDQQGGSQGIGQYLPEAQTTAGKIVGSAAGFVPQAVAGLPGKLATNALLGAATGAASESAGQVADEYAPTLGPAARIGTAILGGGAGAAFPNYATRKAASSIVPTMEDLGRSGSTKFEAVKDLGVTFDPTAVNRGIGGIKTALRDDFGKIKELKPVNKLLGGVEDATAPATLDPMMALTGVRPAVKAPVNVSELQDLRSQLGKLAANTQDRTTRLAAQEAQNHIEEFLGNISKADVLSGDAGAAVNLLKSARSDWGAKRRAEIIAGRIDLGDLNAAKAATGRNVDNATHQAFGALVRPNLQGQIPAKKFGFDAPEIEQLNRVARGDKLQNFFRSAGANTITHGVMGGGGLFEFYRTGDPTWLVPYLGAAGFKKMSGALTKRQARISDEMVRSRSPLANSTYQITQPPQRLTTSATGALLGLPAIRQQLLDHNDGEGSD